MSNHVKGMTSCRPPESEISNEKSNESQIDLINRRDAVNAIRAMQTYKLFAGDDMRLVDQAGAMTELMMLPSAQPEDCDTCKHGYFGDSHCDNCRVRYPSHYERRTDEQTN